MHIYVVFHFLSAPPFGGFLNKKANVNITLDTTSNINNSSSQVSNLNNSSNNSSSDDLSDSTIYGLLGIAALGGVSAYKYKKHKNK